MTAVSPLELYGDALSGRQARLRYDDGRARALDTARWTAGAAGDAALLSRCASATLDVGCGPGRLTRALLDAGVACTGVDVAPVAVALARRGGADVLHCSVHDEVLDGTRWQTVLLADGNIGIGGDPARLLARCRDLLAPGGAVVVELDPPRTTTERVRVRLERDDRSSAWFPWAHVAADAVHPVAAAAGLVIREEFVVAGRFAAVLGRAAAHRRRLGPMLPA